MIAINLIAACARSMRVYGLFDAYFSLAVLVRQALKYD
jgi:hypothetical protein